MALVPQFVGFSCQTKITLQITCLVNNALWTWELDADCGSRVTIQAFENKCFMRMLTILIQGTQYERICMATGQYPRWTSGTYIVKRQASQVIMVWPCPQSLFAAWNHTTVGDGRRRGRLRKSWRDNIKEWTGLSLSLLYIADDGNRWWVTIATEASVW